MHDEPDLRRQRQGERQRDRPEVQAVEHPPRAMPILCRQRLPVRRRAAYAEQHDRQQDRQRDHHEQRHGLPETHAVHQMHQERRDRDGQPSTGSGTGRLV